MSDYIKREDAIFVALQQPLYSVVSQIKQLEGVDIVRCKECRHWRCHNDVDYDQSKFTYYCEVHGISFEGDEFCSYGERSEP